MASFQIKDFVSIVSSMINFMRATQTAITDFTRGGVARTMLEAPATEIDELYQQMFNGLKQAIPVSVYNSFNFPLLDAVTTSGVISVSIAPSSQGTLIPAGTSFGLVGGSTVYVSQVDVLITAGNTTASVLAVCGTAGVAGNIAAGQSFSPAPAIPGLISASNVAAWQNGTDQETEDQRAARFMAYIQTLERGSPAAIEFGLKTTQLTDANNAITERVVFANVYEPYLDNPAQSPGFVNCYVHNGAGSTSSSLVTQAKKIVYGYYLADGTAVPGWKAAGVTVNVYAATEVTVAVSGVVHVSSGYDQVTVLGEVSATVSNYLLSRGIGQPAYLAEIVDQIMSVDGVYNVTLSAPLADATATYAQKLMPGSFAGLTAAS